MFSFIQVKTIWEKLFLLLTDVEQHLEWRKAKPKRLQKHVTLSAQIEGLADAQMDR